MLQKLIGTLVVKRPGSWNDGTMENWGSKQSDSIIVFMENLEQIQSSTIPSSIIPNE